MDQQSQPQVQQIPDVDLTFKLSFVQKVLAALDEIPHKYARNVIDAVTQEANRQLQQMQQAQTAPKVEIPEGLSLSVPQQD